MINIKDLKVGQVIWECESGRNNKLIVKKLPFEADGGWKCLVEASNGEFELFAHDEYPSYAPKLYDMPAYSFSSDIKQFSTDQKSEKYLDETPTL